MTAGDCRVADFQLRGAQLLEVVCGGEQELGELSIVSGAEIEDVHKCRLVPVQANRQSAHDVEAGS